MVESFFPQQKFAAYLFDFDGTVADTMAPHFSAWNHALATYGIELTREQHLGWAGRPTREIVRLLAELHGKELSVDEISKSKELHYLSSFAGVAEIVPVMKIIRDGHGNIPMAVVSGSRRKIVEATMEHLSMKKFFDVIVCAEDYAHGKPAPDCFLLAAQKLNVLPADCLVFEDAELGVQAAHNAGMACLRVTEHPEAGHKLDVSKPLR